MTEGDGFPVARRPLSMATTAIEVDSPGKPYLTSYGSGAVLAHGGTDAGLEGRGSCKGGSEDSCGLERSMLSGTESGRGGDGTTGTWEVRGSASCCLETAPRSVEAKASGVDIWVPMKELVSAAGSGEVLSIVVWSVERRVIEEETSWI
ncbi:hypothetical protein EDB85DRAFT_1892009 [Lactarius pseudohatsudake]|nr:hypothetical protein EDB85DRAFT_1892009 [Lactarius pseudohatsudake]